MGTSRDIRTANRLRLLRRVLAGSPVSRSGLAARTGLSPATVANLVGELTGLGILVEAGREDSAGGRPRGLLALNGAGGALVGVDVAETYLHVEVFDLALRPITEAEEELGSGRPDPGALAARIGSAVEAVIREAGVEPGRTLGAGVSMPGQIDRASGLIAYAPNWGWRDVPLRHLLAERIDAPVYLDNPLRAATLAELWFGAGHEEADTVVVNLGTGVGAGLAFGGSLHRGVSNSAGEWGHTTLVLDGRPCHCGSRGCVETYTGAPGIMRTLREVGPDSPLLHPGDQTATIRALAGAVRAEDPVALRTLHETARYLGAAIADLVNLLNPGAVVLSSWVAAALGEPLLAAVRREVAQRALAGPLAATGIVRSALTSNPVSLGAAVLALEGALAVTPPTAARTRTGPPTTTAGTTASSTPDSAPGTPPAGLRGARHSLRA